MNKLHVTSGFIVVAMLSSLLGVSPAQALTIENNSTGGDCLGIGGLWTQVADSDGTIIGTCQLTADVAGVSDNHAIVIASNNIILDGLDPTTAIKHQIGNSAPDPFGLTGVRIEGKTNVTVRNLIFLRFTNGVDILNGSDNAVIDNEFTAARLQLNLTTGVEVNNNRFYFGVNGVGVQINAGNPSNPNPRDGSHRIINNNFPGNTFTGLALSSSENNLIQGNTFGRCGSCNEAIDLLNSSNNIIENNFIGGYKNHGIRLRGSSDNLLAGNTITGSGSHGINIGNSGVGSDNNEVRNNTLSSNRWSLQVHAPGNLNLIYNNSFISGTTVLGSTTIPQHVANNANTVFSHAAPTGGNYYDTFDEPSEGCHNANDDDFCDGANTFNGGPRWDYLPWTLLDGWAANQPPLANAGHDQMQHPGHLVTLDGSGSSDPDGDTSLTFAWSITGQPAGSTASLTDATESSATLTFDALGNYTLQLVVTDSLGAASAPDEVIVSTLNTPPVADAGADDPLLTELFVPVKLNGTQSFDADGDDFSYLWSLTTPGGLAMLDNNISDMPSFTPDVQGDYVAELVVTDIFGASSDPAQVTLGFTNLAPDADAGNNQSVNVGDTVLVNGMGNDANNDPLTFSWSFVATPAGSAAAFSDPNSENTDFVADVEGTFVASLVVNDGFVDSIASNISILATTVVSQTIELLQDAVAAVNAVPQGSFKNRKMHKPLTNKINAAIALVADGRIAEARDKLLNDVGSKTDGCAKAGAPDRNDWVTKCPDQETLSTLISDAVALLDGLL